MTGFKILPSNQKFSFLTLIMGMQNGSFFDIIKSRKKEHYQANKLLNDCIASSKRHYVIPYLVPTYYSSDLSSLEIN